MIWSALKPDTGSNPQINGGIIYWWVVYSNDTTSETIGEWVKGINPDPEINARIAALNTIYAIDLKTLPLGAPQPNPPQPSPPIDPRAGMWIILKTYDPSAPTTAKTIFNITDTIGVTVEINSKDDGSGSLIPLSGEFAVPVLSDNGIRAIALVKAVTMVNGSGSFTLDASILGSGYFGIDDSTSNVIHAMKQIITVQHP